MTTAEFDLTGIQRGETYFARLPSGPLVELEWVESEVNAVRVVGFISQGHYDADEEYRRAGLEPLLRRFAGHICMKDL